MQVASGPVVWIPKALRSGESGEETYDPGELGAVSGGDGQSGGHGAYSLLVCSRWMSASCKGSGGVGKGLMEPVSILYNRN